MYDSVEPVAKSGFRKTFKRNIQQGTIEKAKNYVLVWIKLPIFRCFGEEKNTLKIQRKIQIFGKDYVVKLCTKLLLHEYYLI